MKINIMRKFRLITLLLLLGLIYVSYIFNIKAQDFNNIVPKPVSIIKQNKNFTIDHSTKINLTDHTDLMFQNGTYLSKQFNSLFHIKLNISTSKEMYNNSINIKIDKSLDKEAYTLKVFENRVNLIGGSHEGVFYGIQSLLQVIPNKNTFNKQQFIEVPGVIIEDSPFFEYRGVMLDVCRHFYNVEEVKRFIDILALHKINQFHWHLTEDQGWRIEINKYPKLTQIGSIREQTLINHYRDKIHYYDGKRYSGFYTKDEIKEVVQYASNRFITVIPEIDMPGHMLAALAAYPHLGCEANKEYKVGEKWGVFEEVLCIGKESTFEFIENVLKEVIEMFPSKYIHIGGDESPTTSWKNCQHCQLLMKEQGISKESYLQNYFTHRIESFLQTHGREMIGWDEVLEGGVSKTATIMSWRGTQGGIDAARKGNKVIMTPGTHCYFDKYQSKNTHLEPLAIGGYLPVLQVYNFDPLKNLNENERKNVLGLQANLWTEYIKDFNHLQYMLLPRLAALAEVGWSYDNKNEEDFINRLIKLTNRYDILGYNYANHISTDIKGKFITADSLSIVGKAMNTSKLFHRVDTAKYTKMPPQVKSLFTNSSGIAISFSTNSTSIAAKWAVKNGKGYPNMSDVNSMGLDLYIKKEDEWIYAGSGLPNNLYSEEIIINNMDTLTKECLLYLPTYDELKSLEIGVDKSSFIVPTKSPFKGKYVIYGSSITQGASASRPGMSYPARMGRATGLNFINLGLSGSGMMESSVIEMLAEIDCNAYIMDCITNPSYEEILERAPNAIRYLREKQPKTPIIFIQSIIREKGLFDQKMSLRNKQQNEAIELVFNELIKKEKISNLYLIKENNFLGHDHEGSIDGTHPNDLGFDRMINAVLPEIKSILYDNYDDNE